MTKLDMAAIKAMKDGKGAGAEAEVPEKADFQANTLGCVITDLTTGEVVLETVLEARGFKANLNKKTGKTVGGCGWYQGVTGDDCGSYRGFPVNAGLRVSLNGIKVSPESPTIDLRTDAEGNDLDEE